MTRWADGPERCGYCREKIEQPPTGRTRKYCSDRCRQRAYRHRKERRRWEERGW